MIEQARFNSKCSPSTVPWLVQTETVKHNRCIKFVYVMEMSSRGQIESHKTMQPPTLTKPKSLTWHYPEMYVLCTSSNFRYMGSTLQRRVLKLRLKRNDLDRASKRLGRKIED